MTKEFKLVVEGMQGVNGIHGVSTEGNGDYEYTRLRGGFGSEDSVMISDLQVAKLLEYKDSARQVRKQFERNKENFVLGEHFYDLKDKNVSGSLSATNTETLKSLGYNNRAIAQAKNIYIFSRAGLLLLLKFVDGENSIKLYKDFIESYFKMSHELEATTHELEVTNKKLELVTDTLEQTVEALEKHAVDTKKQLAYMQVDLVYETDPEERERMHERLQELTELSIEANNALERKKTTDLFLEEYDAQLTFAKTIEDNTADTFDIGDFAKVLNIEGMGRNNMMKWLRDEKILMDSPNKNVPYQKHLGNHFKTVLVTKPNGGVYNKTVLTGSGVMYIVKRLIENGHLDSNVDKASILEQLSAKLASVTNGVNDIKQDEAQ